MKNKISRNIFMGDKMGNPNCLSLSTLAGSTVSDGRFVSWMLESGDRVIDNMNKKIIIDFQGSLPDSEGKRSIRRLDSLKNELIRRL